MKISQSKFIVLTCLSIFLFGPIAYSQDKVIPQRQLDQSQEAKTLRETFTVVEEQPNYKGGVDAFYKYLMSEVVYPAKARNAGAEGVVKIIFNIERDGSVSNLSELEGIGSGCGEEVIRVISKANGFIAGKQRGRTIGTSMMMPITFKLDKEKRNADKSFQGTIIIGELSLNPKELKVTADYKNGEWTGQVLNSKGDKLPGVSIVIAGTNYGTVSDLSGSFSVKAEKDQELHISCVGYESVEVRN